MDKEPPTSRINELVQETLAMESEEARETGNLGFMARSLAQATMPHRNPKVTQFERVNGDLYMCMRGRPSAGLPYGSIPRLLVSWATAEAVRTKQRELDMGSNLNEFMAKLELTASGGSRGDITRLKDQMLRLFSASISCLYRDDEQFEALHMDIIHRVKLWWHPQDPDQIAFGRGRLWLGEDFFEEALRGPVPVDLRALRALKRSSMALDIYTWLTYRMSYLRKRTVIPWEGLMGQFGSDYSRAVDFRRKFLAQLKAVQVVYPDAKVRIQKAGLELRPSRTSIKKD